ncbi:hypothetical protein ACQCRI_02550 [Ralstonia pseudosolanacearum]|uniref:hypothetical protein n=1 Tax=Ralstonia pseudosolanacearum TaxID=1310165 RepID=UPI0005C69801|nr:hypothetical protein [Ralstonia pseudosolanacearum]MCK4147577.1 hypothetical protein [Ralstonia pseudosolanacearum]BCL85505.1 hypothetical protein MAFF211471_05880 [Ralstonia solanacearum]BCM98052.1 hypothetical protein RPSA_05890 [Ralstonia solanacearum]
MIRLSCWVLSIGATGTAICLSVLACWQRGGSLAERLVWVAIGVVLVACAHLLPALVREASVGVRAVAGALWLACMVAACYGHATFFVLAQRHAGELRAAVTPLSEAVPAGRSLTAVMADRAAVTGLLATANAQRCSSNCATLEARRVALTAKLDALDAEAGEIRRRQSADDRAEERRDALVADPVTARLAALLGTTATRVDLLSGLAFAAVLEAAACLLWSVTLQSRPPIPVVPATVAAVTVKHPQATVSHAPEPGSHEAEAERHAPVSEPATPLPTGGLPDPAVTQLAQAVAAGQVRPTVTDIRRFLCVSQARAATLRRQLVAHDSS